MRYETRKLLSIHEQHGKIVVGCDFDDTVFPFTNDLYIETRCEKVRDLLKAVREQIVLCLYSVSDDQSMIYKEHIMRQYGLEPDYINESPVSPWKDSKKPFFNLLLDDKAGLNESIEILTEFYNTIS